MRETVACLATAAALALSACASAAPDARVVIQGEPATTSIAMVANAAVAADASNAAEILAAVDPPAEVPAAVTVQPEPLTVTPLSGDSLSTLVDAKQRWAETGPDTYELQVMIECSLPCVQADPITQSIAVPYSADFDQTAEELLFPEATSVENLFAALADGSLAGPGRLAAVTYDEVLGHPARIALSGPGAATITWQVSVAADE